MMLLGISAREGRKLERRLPPILCGAAGLVLCAD